MDVCLIYITAANGEEARKIGQALVNERLAACVNIIEGMQSLYWWEGAVQSEKEVVLIAKTGAELVDALTARVKALHSYTCPCVVSLPIIGGNPDFLKWVIAEIRH